MLRIGLVRHAKSSWDNPTLNDHDRSLNDRGLRDAPIMAEQVKLIFGVPELLISSTANRALSTAKIFREKMEMDPSTLEEKHEIYHAAEENVLDVISSINDVSYALLFGHNPTMTFLANSFTGGDMISNVPTCGVVMLESTASSWLELNISNTKRIQFIYPKMYV